MDPTWWPWSSSFWIFPMLCMIFMVIMMIAMFRRGSGCMPFGRGTEHGTNRGRDTPQQILDRRYASGEISKEQYEAMRRDLNS